jgi:hypothetical protein
MAGFLRMRPLLAALALVYGGWGAAHADDDRGRSFMRHTHHERSVSDGEGRYHADSDRDFTPDVPDYRVVRGWGEGRRQTGGYALPYRHLSAPEWQAPPSAIIGSGRYSGNVNRWYRSGTGSYFSITRYDEQPAGYAPAGGRATESRSARSRIISVDRGVARRNDAACSFEAGVCVIRGR